jgi:hypothetical protein
MAHSGYIRLPMAIDAKAREDVTLFVITTPPPPATRSSSGSGDPAIELGSRQPPRTG